MESSVANAQQILGEETRKFSILGHVCSTGRDQELPVHVVFGKRLNEKHRWLVRFQMGTDRC